MLWTLPFALLSTFNGRVREILLRCRSGPATCLLKILPPVASHSSKRVSWTRATLVSLKPKSVIASTKHSCEFNKNVKKYKISVSFVSLKHHCKDDFRFTVKDVIDLGIS